MKLTRLPTKYLLTLAAWLPGVAIAHGDPRIVFVPLSLVGLITWIGNGWLARKVFPAFTRYTLTICVVIGLLSTGLVIAGFLPAMLLNLPLALIFMLLLLLGLPSRKA